MGIPTTPRGSINTSPYQLLFGRRAKHLLHPTQLDKGDRATELCELRQEAWDPVQVAVARMKIYHDTKHQQPPTISQGDYIYIKLVKPGRPGYYLQSQTKLSHWRIGLFEVLERLNELRFHVKLPQWLKWKDEISIEPP
jgi:hypothetical protein